MPMQNGKVERSHRKDQERLLQENIQEFRGTKRKRKKMENRV